ncbi:hypothetical protein MBELCI_1020 [Limimaricola cinnabarinus LL-001]|uniref:Uncharacterized protein n=1 Tax=Limimaricola cinnabarinus LL-001 TaxID=1337093 RepID=U3AJK4_9RHOB|nr:hypothetical protein MBELCI_1020 [Limimaricola cinnabarinus LL-001]
MSLLAASCGSGPGSAATAAGDQGRCPLCIQRHTNVQTPEDTWRARGSRGGLIGVAASISLDL